VTLLKHVASVRVSNVDKKSYENEISVRLCNYTDVYYGDTLRADEGNYMTATASAEQIRNFRLKAGDTVLTKDSETADDIGVSAYISDSAPDWVCGYHLAIIRPTNQLVDPRFLFWTSRSTAFTNQLSVAATGVTRYGLRTDAIANVELATLGLDEQRSISDFLDNQVTQLDQSIALRDRQARLLGTRATAHAESILRPGGGWKEVPARHMVGEVAVGIVIQPAVLYTHSAEGVPAVRGTDISPGRIDQENLVRISHEGHAANQRSKLRHGDVLVVRSGRAGAASRVPEWLVGGNCIDVVIVRSGPAVDPGYLEHSINSPTAQEAITEHSTGAIQRHFGVEAMRALPLVRRPLAEQIAIAAELDQSREEHERAVKLLHASKGKLIERKQALITAAVTGQFDVTTARAVA
jgi:type I restriction enzyme S subunit